MGWFGNGWVDCLSHKYWLATDGLIVLVVNIGWQRMG
jgi:hypothetical protein